jgi:hypothetical protein
MLDSLYFCISVFLYLFIYTSLCLSVYLSFCPYDYLSLHLFISQSICLFVPISLCLFFSPSFVITVCLFNIFSLNTKQKHFLLIVNRQHQIKRTLNYFITLNLKRKINDMFSTVLPIPF